MSRGLSSRSEILLALDQMIRENGARSVLISQTVAGLVGLNSTDLECCDFLVIYGPLPAGRLATLTGLTTGAITGVVDRLERAGLVVRDHDPNDRRKVIVRLREDADLFARLGAIYAPLQSAMAELYTHYSDADLAVIVDFLTRAAERVPEVIPLMRAAVEDQ